MAWPPVIPPATRANSTAQLDAHPSDHNAISAALTALLPTAWVALPFAVNWASSGGYQPAQYRRVGDVVQLRGTAARTPVTLVDETVATLPVGFRPPATESYIAQVFGGGVRMDIGADGRIGVLGTYKTGTPTGYNYLNLSGITFVAVMP